MPVLPVKRQVVRFRPVSNDLSGLCTRLQTLKRRISSLNLPVSFSLSNFVIMVSWSSSLHCAGFWGVLRNMKFSKFLCLERVCNAQYPQLICSHSTFYPLNGATIAFDLLWRLCSQLQTIKINFPSVIDLINKGEGQYLQLLSFLRVCASESKLYTVFNVISKN